MNINYEKYTDALVPAIIQDTTTLCVLMLGFMNREAFEKTQAEKKVTFYSRTKKRLWTKGEESGNFLFVNDIKIDCDNDTVLIKATPAGPVCHNGTDTCFGDENKNTSAFLPFLETIINSRKNRSPENSYTSKLFSKGINKIAQKVGEEAVELVIESKDNNDELFLNEAADLMFHYLVLLAAKEKKLDDVIGILKQRHKQ